MHDCDTQKKSHNHLLLFGYSFVKAKNATTKGIEILKRLNGKNSDPNDHNCQRICTSYSIVMFPNGILDLLQK